MNMVLAPVVAAALALLSSATAQAIESLMAPGRPGRAGWPPAAIVAENGTALSDVRIWRATAVDPNLFHLDWGQVAEVLATIVVLSFIVERALALLFEWRFFVNAPWSSGVKEPIAFLVSLAVCWYWRLDALSVILRGEKVGPFGTLLTAAVIAGGSKAALKLFRDVLGVEADNAKKVRLAGAKRDAKPANPEPAG